MISTQTTKQRAVAQPVGGQVLVEGVHVERERIGKEALEELQKNTRNYAKRQLTWFRREPDVIWVSGEELANRGEHSETLVGSRGSRPL